jgi:hypothetical protein
LPATTIGAAASRCGGITVLMPVSIRPPQASMTAVPTNTETRVAMKPPVR